MDSPMLQQLLVFYEHLKEKFVVYYAVIVLLIKFFTPFTLTFLATVITRRRWFHPLSSYPGPFFWTVSRLPMFYYLMRGTLPYKISELHDQYGPVVRLAPEELSFTTEEAWPAIYHKPVNKPQLQKDPLQFLPPATGVMGLFFEPNDTAHGRLRRNFSHAFSEKSMREQEPIINKYIDLLISRLNDNVGKPIDICMWYACVSFDIIGDLTFGDSFQSLENSDLHPWIRTLFNWVAGVTMLGMMQKFWPLDKILLAMVPKHMRDAEAEHRAFTANKMHKRLNNKAPRPDFISHVEKFLNTPNGLTLPEMLETCRSLIVGGSETTMTIVSAATYYLLRNPYYLAQLTAEIRTAFGHPSQINMRAVNNLPYLDAVLNETLRLFSPTPGNLRRITPKEGITIGDYRVPGGVLVAVDLYSAGHAASNFARPHEFRPDRYLPDAPEEFKNDKLMAVQSFSAGPRNCIGKNLAWMELRLILARVLYSFDLEFGEGGADWMKDMKVYGFFEKGPLMVKLTPAHA